MWDLSSRSHWDLIHRINHAVRGMAKRQELNSFPAGGMRWYNFRRRCWTEGRLGEHQPSSPRTTHLCKWGLQLSGRSFAATPSRNQLFTSNFGNLTHSFSTCCFLKLCVPEFWGKASGWLSVFPFYLEQALWWSSTRISLGQGNLKSWPNLSASCNS